MGPNKKFAVLCSKFRKFEDEFFAARLNSKCCNCVSYKPDPHAYEVFVLTVFWSKISGYFCVSLKFNWKNVVQNQLRQSSNTVSSLVVTRWQAQLCSPPFARMVKLGTKLVLMQAHSELLQPLGKAERHPLCRKKLKLIAVLLSGTSQQKVSHLGS